MPCSSLAIFHRGCWVRTSGRRADPTSAFNFVVSFRAFHSTRQQLAKPQKRSSYKNKQAQKRTQTRPQPTSLWSERSPNSHHKPDRSPDPFFSSLSPPSSLPTTSASSSNSATPTLRRGWEMKVPMLEKLFPDHVTEIQRPLPPGEREVPRLALKLPTAMTELLRQSKSNILSGAKRRTADFSCLDNVGTGGSIISDMERTDSDGRLSYNRATGQLLDDFEGSIVILSGASPNLERSDFERSQPTGKDLAWTGAGQFVQVIPLRQLPTLEKTGSYMLIFPSTHDHRQYIQHLHQVHKLMVQHSPSSILSRLTPPPGYLQNDVDAYTALQNFTLVPPLPELHIRYLSTKEEESMTTSDSPISRKNAISQLWRLGNYAELTSKISPPKIYPAEGMTVRNRDQSHGKGITLPSIFADPEWDAPKNREYRVLFWVDGRQPDDAQLAHAIRHHGTKRGKQWQLASEREPIVCINRWRTHRPTGKVHSRTGFEEFGQGERNASQSSSFSGHSQSTLQDGQKRHWEGPPKWRIGFATEEEARRFARTWDGRPFPWVDPFEDTYDSQALQRLKKAAAEEAGAGLGDKGDGEGSSATEAETAEELRSLSKRAQRKGGMFTYKNLDDYASKVYAEYIWT